MTRAQIIVPDHLIGVRVDLPYDLTTPIHTKEPEAAAIYRMLGFEGQQPRASVVLNREGDGYVARTTCQGGMGGVSEAYECTLSPVRASAIASWIEGYLLSEALKLVKVHGGGVSGVAEVLESVLRGAQRQIVNAWMGQDDRYPWNGLGIIPMSPDGELFLFARKDHQHPCAMYCGRLALIGGGMDLNEMTSDWGGFRSASLAGVYREVFEEIPDVRVAEEICASLTDYGSVRVGCVLYEDDGRFTEGSVRALISRAPSMEVWGRWQEKLFGPDGLSEACPELVTRASLLRMLEEDQQAGAERVSHLMDTDSEVVADRERKLLERYTWRYYREQLSHLRATLSEKEFLERVDLAWSIFREEGLKQGVFPLMHRGRFNFISGHASAIKRVLKAANLS